LIKENDISQIKIKMPVIVKPAREDNSNGVSHVKKRKDLQAALDEAFRWDDKILIE
jgi:D-alanine-D-alanine ligase